MTSKGYVQVAGYVQHHMVCFRVERVSQVPCDAAARWQFSGSSQIESADHRGMCLERAVYSGDQVKLRRCSGRTRQHWELGPGDGNGPGGTLSGPDRDICLDNMQKKTGAPGLYGCHGHGTQRWEVDGGQLRSSQHKGEGVCVGFSVAAGLFQCLPDDDDYVWDLKEGLLRSRVEPEWCLTREGGKGVTMRRCTASDVEQQWVFAQK